MSLENSYSSDDEKDGHMPKRGSETKKSATPVLDNFSRNLVELAIDGGLDQVIGRDEEITRIAQILRRRLSNEFSGQVDS